MKLASLSPPLLLSLLTGLLLASAWPARGFPFLAFVAFIPLLQAEAWYFSRRDRYSGLSFLLHAWAGFFAFNLLTTWWIVYSTIPGMLAAVTLNASFMALPWWLMHLARRRSGGRQGPLAVVLLWLAFEHLHTQWELSWSWLDLGNVFAAHTAWIQWFEYTGVAGGALWVLAVNLLLFSALIQYRSAEHFGKRAAWNTALALIVFVLPSALSFHIFSTYEETHDPVEVVVVQPAEDPYEPALTTAEVRQRVETMLNLAELSTGPNTRFVVAPEVANPQGIWLHEAGGQYTVRRLREHMEEHPGLAWVLGSFTYRLYRDGEAAPKTARPYGNSGLVYDVYNSAILAEGDFPLQVHHKSKLVPGIERMPYFTLLRPLGKLVDRLGGIAGSLGTGNPQVFETSRGEVVAPAICYESIYGEHLSGQVIQGATLIFIITNDGWWRDTPGYRQHNQYARIRAVETRRSIARSASTGISSFIGQKGEIIKQSEWNEPGSMAATLHHNNRITFYTRTGNFIGRISVFLSALLLLYMLVLRISGKTGRMG